MFVYYTIQLWSWLGKFCFRFSFIFLNFILFFVLLRELRASNTLPFPLGLVSNSMCLCYFTWSLIIFLPMSEIDRLWPPLLAKRLKAVFLAFWFFWITSTLFFLKNIFKKKFKKKLKNHFLTCFWKQAYVWGVAEQLAGFCVCEEVRGRGRHVWHEVMLFYLQ